MKTLGELEQEILDIILKIQAEFQLLLKYISEVTEHIPSLNCLQNNHNKFKEYCASLEKAVLEYTMTEATERNKNKKEVIKFHGYIFPLSDDELSHWLIQRNIYPNDQIKNEEEGTGNKKSIDEDLTGDDLNIPRSKLDNHQGYTGIDAGENNY